MLLKKKLIVTLIISFIYSTQCFCIEQSTRNLAIKKVLDENELLYLYLEKYQQKLDIAQQIIRTLSNSNQKFEANMDKIRDLYSQLVLLQEDYYKGLIENAQKAQQLDEQSEILSHYSSLLTPIDHLRFSQERPTILEDDLDHPPYPPPPYSEHPR